MCRIKRDNKNFDLIIDGKLVKSFRSRTSLSIYVRDLEIKNYYIKEGVSGARNKRVC